MRTYTVLVRTEPLFIRHKAKTAEEAAEQVREMLNNGLLDDALHNQGHTINAYRGGDKGEKDGTV